MKEIAEQFGRSLDNDDYEKTLSLLAKDCLYDIGHETIEGAAAIVDSYKQNMIAGRKKMDQLEWGQSTIDQISENEFIVNFTDYLFHNGEKYTYKCQQRLLMNKESQISRIEHIQDDAAWKELQDWYQSVGIPTAK